MILALDFETFAMSPSTGPTPEPVCLAITVITEDAREDALVHIKTREAYIKGKGHAAVDPNDKRTVGERLTVAINKATWIVGQNIAFDLGVAIAHLSDGKDDLLKAIIKALDEGRVYDTKIAQQLINLEEHGVISEGFVRGLRVEFKYGLDELAKAYGVLPDGYEQMKHGGDAWRVRYGELIDVPLAQWPQEAIDYPILDNEVTLQVMLAQRTRHRHPEVLPMRVKIAFAVRIVGACGVTIDKTVREEIRESSEAIDKHYTAPLIGAGIITPEIPPQPYKPRGKAQKPVLNPDGSLKMKAAEPQKLNKKALVQHILSLVTAGQLDPVDIVLSEAALKDKEFIKAFEVDVLKALIDNPEYVSTSEEFMAEHAGAGDKVFEEMTLLEVYRARQKVQKILTTELPRISPPEPWNGIAWPEYDSIKDTGRVSSFASKLFPSLNAQNIAKAMRRAFRSSADDRLLLSADFSSMELVSAAQVCLDKFGKSVLADIIKAGKDAHAYLGAQICYSQDLDFKRVCDDAGDSTVEGRYKHFVAMKKTNPEKFKHYRTLAKPTGLGLWGGLGAETFVTYAKTTYGVRITLDQAKALIEIWHLTFPEARLYFDAMTTDEKHSFSKKVTKSKSKVIVDADGNKRVVIETEDKMTTFNKYVYRTRGGLVRSNADYCAAANGEALQSASAEGALMATYEVVCECLLGNLYGAVPYAVIHDEIVLDVPQDKETVAKCYAKLDEIMVRNFALYTAPDVPIKTEIGLMRNWDKAAGPDRYEDGSWMTIEEKNLGLKENPR